MFNFGVMILLSTGKLTTGGKKFTPDGVDIYNPAFDVTPAKNITAIITERGVIEKPNGRKIKIHHEDTKNTKNFNHG